MYIRAACVYSPVRYIRYLVAGRVGSGRALVFLKQRSGNLFLCRCGGTLTCMYIVRRMRARDMYLEGNALNLYEVVRTTISGRGTEEAGMYVYLCMSYSVCEYKVGILTCKMQHGAAEA